MALNMYKEKLVLKIHVKKNENLHSLKAAVQAAESSTF